MKIDLFGLPLEAVETLLVAHKIPKFRAKQIYNWLYTRHVHEFSGMKNLGASTIAALEAEFCISVNQIKPINKLVSKDGNTQKVLLEFVDGQTCECVLMRHNYGNSVCVSSQIGCAIGCKFCASGLNGFVRNLSTAEMLAQVEFFAAQLAADGERISHIVIMGSGEPLLNYDNVLGFINMAHNPEVLNISYRNITLSTSGIVPGIEKLQQENLPINLAISLHAPNDTKRSEIMPINNTYPLNALIYATRKYARATKRQITYEYVLIQDFNDSIEDAQELSELLRGHIASVNLIPVNSVQEHGNKQSAKAKINNFLEYLQKNNTPATIRKEMGADINAACGQLRNKHLEK